MTRQNTVILNVSGGEISSELFSRLDLRIYQRGNRRVQNYEVLPQGGLRFRNGLKRVNNTRGSQSGRLINFTFSDSDTYILEFTHKKLRFYRNFSAVLLSPKTITAITKASPAVVTSNAHGFSNGDEVFLSGIKGMVELNNQFFKVANSTANTFELQNVFGGAIDSTDFETYASGGQAAEPYEISTPYEAGEIDDLHFAQSADTMEFTHPNYPPYELVRADHTSWTLSIGVRTNDPLRVRPVNTISQANPGVIHFLVNHGFSADEIVYIDNVGGMTNLNGNRYKVDQIPTLGQITLKDAVTGVPVNTTGFPAFTGGGLVMSISRFPRTVAFLGEARKVYANIPEDPALMLFSRAPDPNTGVQRFNDFTTGADYTDACSFSLTSVFDRQDAIQWLRSIGKGIVVGCTSSLRRVTGATTEDPISPGSIRALPINNVGSIDVQSFSNGQSCFYIDSTGRRVYSFLYGNETQDFVTANQHLAANQLGAEKFKAIAQQRGDAGLLWVLRNDGVLTGLTFNEVESIFGWHRHYIGGVSEVDGVEYERAKVLSIAVEPRIDDESVLWAIVERKIGENVYRSVEFLKAPVRFVEQDDFFSERSREGRAQDLERYFNAKYEQLKDSVHLDGSLTYDGAELATVSMTPSAVDGDAITLTAGSAFFDDSMVGRQVWKKYNKRGIGGGRAEIVEVTDSTHAVAKVLVPFNNTSTMPANTWMLTAQTVYGLLHFAGQQLMKQCDGAPDGFVQVAPDGSVDLEQQTSKAHIGFGYLGLSIGMNLDVGGVRGSAQAKVRKVLSLIPTFKDTVGAVVGTDIWTAQEVSFKSMDDYMDRPSQVFDGTYEVVPVDEFSRDSKKTVLMQVVPGPQTLLSFDVMVETADE